MVSILENQRIVCDIGTGTMKVGFAGEDAPRAVFSSMVDVPHHARDRVGMGQKEGDVGDEAESKRHAISLGYPIEHGVVKNWEGMEKIWRRIFDDELHVDPTEHVVLFTEPPLNPKTEREKMAELLFETFEVPAIYIAPQPMLSLYARGRLNGTVLNSGDGVSYAVPCFLGAHIYDAITRIDVAGGDVTDSLMASLTGRGYDVSDRERVREIKEKLGYIAVDYEVEMERSSSALTQYTLPDGRSFAIGTERFRDPEVLFRPSLIGREGPDYGELFDNIILTGGSTLLPGFAKRLEKEIAVFDKLEGINLKKRIVATPERRLGVWIGGSMVAAMGPYAEVYQNRIPLAVEFPRLCRLETDVDAKFSERGGWVENRLEWEWRRRREPRGREIGELGRLLEKLRGWDPKRDTLDVWEWDVDVEEGFTVKNCRERFIEGCEGGSISEGEVTLWNNLIPRKINIFMWRSRMGRIPTRVALNDRGIDLDSILCPWCGEEVENIDHALVNCREVKNLWIRLGKWWSKNLEGIGSLSQLIQEDVAILKAYKGRSIWIIVKWAALYLIWQDRNNTIFKQSKSNLGDCYFVWQRMIFEWINSKSSRI
ncbi:hypothetical protein OSB04_012118 [Centaurea solstitialis]|uniref:Reverse transcriptase zinc-binding domain-containing protein n=1 Tax=Centaurea solstitialis TaxID=347529 RepID=A0AA38TAS3_9ASTR|nr:hypothetical protein OSB04_012118 [Centaurea solstitialis]